MLCSGLRRGHGWSLHTRFVCSVAQVHSKVMVCSHQILHQTNNNNCYCYRGKKNILERKKKKSFFESGQEDRIHSRACNASSDAAVASALSTGRPLHPAISCGWRAIAPIPSCSRGQMHVCTDGRYGVVHERCLKLVPCVHALMHVVVRGRESCRPSFVAPPEPRRRKGSTQRRNACG